MIKRLYSAVLGNQEQPLVIPLNSTPQKKREVKLSEKDTLATEIFSSSSVQEEVKDNQKQILQLLGHIDSLQCSICMDFILNCRTAVCGHSFCHVCIEESLLRKKECPNCRKEIRKWGCQKSELIDQAVDLVIQSRSSQGDSAEATRWQERKDNFKTWLDKHNVKNVKAGQVIDCLDTEHIWCQATVELKI